MIFDDVDFGGRMAFITGTSRSIGKAIALDLADRGANVVSTGKAVGRHEDLPGTVVGTTEEIHERGNSFIWCQLDMHDDASVQTAIGETVDALSDVDFVVNNAGTIHTASSGDTPPKRFDLLMDVNARRTCATTHAVLPYLRESDHARVVAFSSPMPTRPAPGEVAYAFSRYGMTFTTQSLTDEFDADDVGVNALWLIVAIKPEATRHFGMNTPEGWRTLQIMYGAIAEPFSRDPTDYTGNAFYGEEPLSEVGAGDFSSYVVVKGSGPRPMSAQLFDPDYER